MPFDHPRRHFPLVRLGERVHRGEYVYAADLIRRICEAAFGHPRMFVRGGEHVLPRFRVRPLDVLVDVKRDDHLMKRELSAGPRGGHQAEERTNVDCGLAQEHP